MSEDFQNTGYILHPAKGKIPFFCNFATVEDLEAAISKLNSLTPKVVDELPPVGESGILYFVPSTDASSEDQSKEYIWLEQENRFELVGSTGVDLSDVVTISSDQVISGIKTFTDGIVLSDGKQISLGSGTNAVRIHGTGTGNAVIEADNGAELDVAVPVNIQETLEIDKLKTDITGLSPIKIDLFTFKNKNRPNYDMRLYQYTTTSLVGIQGVVQGGGFNVDLNGGVTCESSLLVRGGITSHSGVTISQSLTVLGIANFRGGFVTISDSSGDLDKTIEIKLDTGGTAISVPPVIGSLYDDDRAVYSRIDNDQRYIKFVELTEAEYKELETKSVSTIYYLSDIAMWAIGDKEIITSDITA